MIHDSEHVLFFDNNAQTMPLTVTNMWVQHSRPRLRASWEALRFIWKRMPSSNGAARR